MEKGLDLLDILDTMPKILIVAENRSGLEVLWPQDLSYENLETLMAGDLDLWDYEQEVKELLKNYHVKWKAEDGNGTTIRLYQLKPSVEHNLLMEAIMNQ